MNTFLSRKTSVTLNYSTGYVPECLICSRNSTGIRPIPSLNYFYYLFPIFSCGNYEEQYNSKLANSNQLVSEQVCCELHVDSADERGDAKCRLFF